MDRTEQTKLSTIAADLAATDPGLARLLTDAPSRPSRPTAGARPDSADQDSTHQDSTHQDSTQQDGPGRQAGSALATATVGLMILVAGLVVSSSLLTVAGLVVMIVLPAPVASGMFSRRARNRDSSRSS